MTYYLDDTFLVTGLQLKLLALYGEKDLWDKILTNRVSCGSISNKDRIPFDKQLSEIRKLLNYSGDDE